MKYISITVSVIRHNRNEFKNIKQMLQIFNDTLNTWCHVYLLYMHSNIQYVNKNTGMPIKGIYMYMFSEARESVMWKRRLRLFLFFSPLCMSLERKWKCLHTLLLRVIWNELVLTIRMCILILAPTFCHICFGHVLIMFLSFETF